MPRSFSRPNGDRIFRCGRSFQKSVAIPPTEIGDALYPAEVSFVGESFAWHVAVWFSTAGQPLAALVADVYLNAVTGAFLGKPSRETLAQRLNQALVSQGKGKFHGKTKSG
jgi:hypothetical protein